MLDSNVQAKNSMAKWRVELIHNYVMSSRLAERTILQYISIYVRLIDLGNQLRRSRDHGAIFLVRERNHLVLSIHDHIQSRGIQCFKLSKFTVFVNHVFGIRESST